MTPAIDTAKKARIEYAVHEYVHDPAARSYGEEAAAALEISPERVFKTLLVSLDQNDKQLAVAIVPVSRQLDLKALARAARAKKADLAEARAAEKATGYVLGGISPLGQRKRLPTILDESALRYETIYVSAGKRGLEIELDPGDLMRLCNAKPGKIAR